MIEPGALGALLAAIAGGDRAALRELFTLTAPRLYGIALRLLRDPERASQVLRVIFLEIDEQADTIAAEPDPLWWIVARVREEALDLLRTQGGATLVPDLFEAEDDVADPLAGAERSAGLITLLTCLGQISAERRRMLLLAYFDGWSREALSVYFDAPVHAVNTWLWRSIAELDGGLDQ